MNKMRKCVGVLGLCCLLLLTGLLSGCGQIGLPEGVGHYCGPPQLMMNGEIYKSTGITRPVYTTWAVGERVFLAEKTEPYLPEGYTAYGAVTLVDRAPEKDGEGSGMGEGTIYTNAATPETVYVYTETYSNMVHALVPHYVRYVSPALYAAENVARWSGRDYEVPKSNGAIVTDLPAGCTELGALHYIGRDALPARDLETNSLSYGEGCITDGCMAYADVADAGCLYLQVEHYGENGWQTAYLRCPLWMEE